MTISTGKCYTKINATSFVTTPNDCFKLGDHLTEVTAGTGFTELLSSIVHVTLSCSCSDALGSGFEERCGSYAP